MQRTETCQVCRGEGVVEDELVAATCEHCAGNGYVTVDSEPADMAAALDADGEKLRQLTGEDHGPFDIDLTNDRPAPGRMANQTWRILEEQRQAAEETLRECDIEIARWSAKRSDALKTKAGCEAGQAALEEPTNVR